MSNTTFARGEPSISRNITITREAHTKLLDLAETYTGKRKLSELIEKIGRKEVTLQPPAATRDLERNQDTTRFGISVTDTAWDNLSTLAESLIGIDNISMLLDMIGTEEIIIN